MSILAVANLQAFFFERLESAKTKLGVQASEACDRYLVGLLCESGPSSLATADQPLVSRLAEAASAASEREKLRAYRELGDAALYTSGFFGDHLEVRGLSPDYVARIGGGAYLRAAELSSGETAFSELGNHFPSFARLLDEVREASVLRTPQDIVRLYDRWRKTGSPELATRLASEGVYPTRGDRGLH